MATAGLLPAPEELTAALADIPEGQPTLPTLLRAFHAIVPMLERNRPVSEPLARLAAVTPALRERQAAKGARLVEMLTDALGDRGVDDELAALAAQTGWAALTQAMHRWMVDPSGGLEAQVEAGLPTAPRGRHRTRLIGQPHNVGRVEYELRRRLSRAAVATAGHA